MKSLTRDTNIFSGPWRLPLWLEFMAGLERDVARHVINRVCGWTTYRIGRNYDLVEAVRTTVKQEIA